MGQLAYGVSARVRNDQVDNPGGTPGRASAQGPRASAIRTSRLPNAVDPLLHAEIASGAGAISELLKVERLGRLRAPVCRRNCERARRERRAERWIGHRPARPKPVAPPLYECGALSRGALDSICTRERMLT